MKKFLLLTLLFSITISAQDAQIKDFDSIVNMKEAKEYIKEKKSKKNKIIIFNEAKHQSALALDLYKSGAATVVSDTEKTKYKVIEKTTTTNYRVSYIFFDGLKMSYSQINTLRDKILKKYKEGTPFSQLAKQYSMDENANNGGDLGWFEKGLTHPTFEAEISNNIYKIGDVFTIDIVQNQWYYVILKTHDPKEIQEIKVLKIVEPLK
ncbi:peptidyl-prolyl cis-trans isomerase [Lacinutrix sp. C3R15]|uniref:peptidylprolyl isomerase n=1 Tax=Flavobacteriaceae TaxID=49546 RepID=UPI001C08B65F|nr:MULTISPECIES: peptidylprolyl isomerase [Flavobacteriaceae]MBU2938696.1 peptidyl-prolyl cis-trans isomerase [Lacinutrix sp. C3R15]MDO6622010.1 peptidylprolyl isomerase [Oceanihabitans sp. 1_MG-2023]